MSEHVFNNRYRVLAQIAGGGMAVVYKAHDTILNRVVAVKVLRDSFAQDIDFRTRFQHEAQSAANLGHPNIVTVYDYGQDGAQSYIVMEYVEGETLGSRSHRRVLDRAELHVLDGIQQNAVIQCKRAAGECFRRWTECFASPRHPRLIVATVAPLRPGVARQVLPRHPGARPDV